MTLATPAAVLALLSARVAFAVAIGTLAVGNLLDLEGSVAYAAGEGVPAARLTVPAGSAALLLGAAAVLVGTAPLFGALAIAGFLVAVTPVMHDFWTMAGENRAAERVHFLKNLGLLAAALAFAALATVEWPYALEVGP